jgi:hypothetical protein
MNPPISSIGIDTGTWTSGNWPVSTQSISGALIIPARMDNRHPRSGAAAMKAPVRIPVAPMTRPSTSISNVAASPIRAPPASDCHGVKMVSMRVTAGWS